MVASRGYAPRLPGFQAGVPTYGHLLAMKEDHWSTTRIPPRLLMLRKPRYEDLPYVSTSHGPKPCPLRDPLVLTTGVEPVTSCVSSRRATAVPSEHRWSRYGRPPQPVVSRDRHGVDDGIRTHDDLLGKQAFYR